MLLDKNKTPYLILTGLMAFLIFFKFPGKMEIDSLDIYTQAIKGSYNDHHPPLMGFLWHHLNFIYEGPALMFLINMALIFSAACLGIIIFSTHPLRFWFAALPFIPHIYVHMDAILKDHVFTFGYGVLVMMLAKTSIDKKALTIKQILLFFTLLIYATSVKFQAKFVLPIVLFWFLQVQYSKRNLGLRLVGTVVLTFFVTSFISGINSWIINTKGMPTHSWQYVKIYDLAGMSLHANQVLTPAFLHKNKSVSVDSFRRKYKLHWEPLIQEEDSPIRATQSDSERKALQKTWKRAVMNYPLAYIKHRGDMWIRGLMLGSPLKGFIEENYNQISWVKKYVFPLGSVGAFIFLLPFLVFFIYQNIRNRKKDTKAEIGLFLQLISLTMLGVLFVFSLAAVARYVYFSTYIFMLSVPFSLGSLFHNKKD